MRHVRWMLCVLHLVAGTSAMAQQPASGVSTESSPDPCPVYLAALDEVLRNDTTPVVVYDSTSMGTPTFAFHAWVGMPPKPDSLFPNADSLFQALRATLAPRGPLPMCLETDPRVRRFPYAAMQEPFRDRARGWELFTEAFAGARRLALLSHVLWVNGDPTVAVLYVGTASHWLAGGGDVYLMRLQDDRWSVIARRALWRS